MDAFDYVWHFSSELLVASLVLIVAGFNFLVFRDNAVNDQSLTRTFLGYHVAQNPELYVQASAQKTLVYQKGSPFVQEALANENQDLPPLPTPVGELESVKDNTLVAYNPDSISQLLKRQVKVYKTKEGDTLGSIAKEHGISTETIIEANNLGGWQISKDWELLIPQADGLIIEAGPNTTLPDIANKYKGKLDQLIAYNGLASAEDIEAGDYIFCLGCTVPAAQPKPAPAKPSSKRQIGIADDSVPGGPRGHIFPKGYCTWYVAQKVKITFGGNAKNWLANGKAAGYETGNTPRKGAVVVTTDNARYGHVAYITDVTDTHIKVSEMNFVGFNKVSSRSIPINSKTIRGYVYPKY